MLANMYVPTKCDTKVNPNLHFCNFCKWVVESFESCPALLQLVLVVRPQIFPRIPVLELPSPEFTHL